jgi:hypothetical protein
VGEICYPLCDWFVNDVLAAGKAAAPIDLILKNLFEDDLNSPAGCG